MIELLRGIKGLSCDGLQIHVPNDKSFNEVVGSREKALLEEFAIVSQALTIIPRRELNLEEEVQELGELVDLYLESPEVAVNRKGESMKLGLEFNLRFLKKAEDCETSSE